MTKLELGRNTLCYIISMLRLTPVEDLAKCYEIINEQKIENARMATHASVMCELLEEVLTDFDLRYAPDQVSPELAEESAS